MKKNHLALLFLTVITMVAVWYLKSPLSANTTPNEDDSLIIASIPTRLAELTTMREAVRLERSQMASTYDEIIASADTSVSDKSSAIKNKQSLSDLTEKEVLMEVQIINLGYQDAFVHQTAEGVEAIIIASEDSGQTAVDIINMIYLHFTDSDNVIVSFKTPQELKSA